MVEIKAEIFLKYRGSLRDSKNCYVVFLSDCNREIYGRKNTNRVLWIVKSLSIQITESVSCFKCHVPQHVNSILYLKVTDAET